MMLHFARTIDFDTLHAGLEAARTQNHLYARESGDGRKLYCYTAACVYDSAWTDFTRIGRGIILAPAERRVVATPFPKFFNYGEHGLPFPDLPFEAFEKVDGSLIIAHYHGNAWRASTKGSFDSWQAVWAEQELARLDTAVLDRDTTHLFEMAHPKNRIVVPYEREELVLLGAYDGDGRDVPSAELQKTASRLGVRMAERYHFSSPKDILAAAAEMPATAEGFVLRFANGLRVKVKGSEYRRIHALITRCTPLTMWEAMRAESDMAAIRRDLPEEFLTDFDDIVMRLEARIDGVFSRLEAANAPFADKDDKEVGLRLSEIDPELRRMIFSFRRNGRAIEAKTRAVLMALIRPHGNDLDGYLPSYAMKRMLEESL